MGACTTPFFLGLATSAIVRLAFTCLRSAKCAGAKGQSEAPPKFSTLDTNSKHLDIAWLSPCVPSGWPACQRRQTSGHRAEHRTLGNSSAIRRRPFGRERRPFGGNSCARLLQQHPIPLDLREWKTEGQGPKEERGGPSHSHPHPSPKTGGMAAEYG